MRAIFFLTSILSIFFISLSKEVTIKNVTISGLIINEITGEQVLNAKIEFTRIGKNISIKDTLNILDGSYSYIYPFEITENGSKYERIKIKPLNTETNWYIERSFPYTLDNIFYYPLRCYPNSYTDTISGYVKTLETNLPVPDIKLELTQMNEDSTLTIKDTLITDNNGFYKKYTQPSNFKYFMLEIISDKWIGKIKGSPSCNIYYWEYINSYDLNFDVTLIDTSKIPIFGKTFIKPFSNSTTLKFNDQTAYSDRISGNYIYYVPRGWSGEVTPQDILNNLNWVPASVIVNNIQEPKTINFTGEIDKITLSGHTYIDKGDSLELTLLHFSSGDYSVTNSKGYYNIELPKETYIRKITPIKEGYTFIPDTTFLWASVYYNLTLNFKAIPNKKVTVNGKVNDNSRAGIDNVTLTFSGTGNGSCTTEKDGSFNHSIRMDWSGTIIPYKEGLIFDPPILSINNINEDMTFDFTGIDTTITQTLSNKPINLNKKPDFEIFIYNLNGKLIGSAKNIKIAKLLTKNANGLYFYQHRGKNITIKINPILFLK